MAYLKILFRHSPGGTAENKVNFNNGSASRPRFDQNTFHHRNLWRRGRKPSSDKSTHKSTSMCRARFEHGTDLLKPMSKLQMGCRYQVQFRKTNWDLRFSWWNEELYLLWRRHAVWQKLIDVLEGQYCLHLHGRWVSQTRKQQENVFCWCRVP
jgi:hypothetical protein